MLCHKWWHGIANLHILILFRHMREVEIVGKRLQTTHFAYRDSAVLMWVNGAIAMVALYGESRFRPIKFSAGILAIGIQAFALFHSS